MQELIWIVIIVVLIIIGLAFVWIYNSNETVSNVEPEQFVNQDIKTIGRKRYGTSPRTKDNILLNSNKVKAGISKRANKKVGATSNRNVSQNKSALVDTKFGRIVRNMSKPADQFHCNSCWAISTCQAVSDRLRLKGKINSTDELNYYEFHDHIVEITPNIDGCEYGAYIETGMEMMDKIGAPLMSKTKDREFNDTAIASDTLVPTFKTVEWKRLPFSQIKEELETNGTVVAMINLYDSFYDFVGSGIYKPRVGEQSDPDMVHMISIVGYDDRDNTWIIRNSYGNSSGYQGFIKIPIGNDQLGTEMDVFAPVI